MNARDLLQAGINEAGGCGWSALLAAPSIVELLRRADAVPPLSPDVAALRDALLDDFEAMGYGHRPVVQRRIDALIEAAVRAAEAEVAGLTPERLADALVEAGIGAWDFDHINRALAALAAQPAAPEPEPERCADCGHERGYHAPDLIACDCEGDGEAGLCACSGWAPR